MDEALCAGGLLILLSINRIRSGIGYQLNCDLQFNGTNEFFLFRILIHLIRRQKII